MAFDVKSVWAGALTPTSVRVIADTAPPTDGSLLVADNEAMTGPVTIGPVTATSEGILDFTVTGLDPDTRYWYVVDAGGLNVSYKGSFKTHPGPAGEPASYIFGAAGDAGLTGDGDEGYITDAVSNNPVFDTMAAQSAAEDWAWFSHLGDLHYRNIDTNDPSLYRAAFDDNFNFNLGFNPEARQGAFLRGQAITYVWDDHDFGANNSDRTNPGAPAAQQVYRECVPHYPLADSAAIYQTWQAGRVLYVATDSRSYRDPNTDPVLPTKTMLGTAQKAWFENLLATARGSGAEVLVWQSSSRWVGGIDTWSSFPYERDEMVQMFGDYGWLDRMIFMTADMHAMSMCSGPHNPYGRFPMFMYASMDAGAWDNAPGDYDLGSVPGRRQYGTMRVTDNGHTIALAGTGYHDGTVMMANTAYLHVSNPVWALDGKSGGKGDLVNPFAPVLDDQGMRNDMTAKRQDGGEATFVDQAHVDARGRYDADITVNVESDDQLADEAAWRVHLGTTPGMRYPAISPALNVRPELVGQWLATELGDAGEVTGLPPQHPTDTVSLIAEGYRETIQPHRWDVTANTAAASPYTVAQLPAARELSIDDGTFETGVTGWTATNGTFVQSDEQAHQGTYSGKLTVTGTPTQAYVRPYTYKVPVTPGESYRLSFWAYSPDGYADLTRAIDWQDSGGNYLSTGASSASIDAGGWFLQTDVFTAPVGAAYAVYGPTLGSNPPTDTVLYVDEVKLWEAAATAASAGPDRPNRLDTTGSRLVSAITDTATSVVVHTAPDGVFDRAPWIVSTGPATAPNLLPAHFPLDVRLGGETVRVTACEPGVWDDFDRTVSNDWGTADSGQTWTTAGGSASDYSVAPSSGRIAHNSRNVFRIVTAPAPGPDVDLRHSWEISATPAGDSIYMMTVARYTTDSSCWFARVQITTASAMVLSLRKRTASAETQLVSRTLPGTFAAGAVYWTRLATAGTTLMAKVWPDGTAEPHDWHAIATDTEITAAGSVGVRTLLGSSNSNTLPVTMYIDTFEMRSPQRMTVTRGVNGVTKAQDAGTAVSLAQPAPVAL